MKNTAYELIQTAKKAVRENGFLCAQISIDEMERNGGKIRAICQKGKGYEIYHAPEKVFGEQIAKDLISLLHIGIFHGFMF